MAVDGQHGPSHKVLEKSPFGYSVKLSSYLQRIHRFPHSEFQGWWASWSPEKKKAERRTSIPFGHFTCDELGMNSICFSIHHKK